MLELSGDKIYVPYHETVGESDVTEIKVIRSISKNQCELMLRRPEIEVIHLLRHIIEYYKEKRRIYTSYYQLRESFW